MKTKRILKEESIYAFGSPTKQSKAIKSIKVFLQRATDQDLDVVANALRRITLKAINISKIDNAYDIAQIKAAVDLLKPAMLETLFGELKQAYPQNIDYNPYVMEPEEAPQQQAPQQPPAPQQATAPQEEPQTMQERKMLKNNKQTPGMKSLKEQKFKKLIRLMVLKEMQTSTPMTPEHKKVAAMLNSMNWPELQKYLKQDGYESFITGDQASTVADLVKSLDIKDLKGLAGM